ncbi:MAG: phospho-N-acetylmuramoyl-pentapeptide-transferase [Spirochaetia bacterium]
MLYYIGEWLTQYFGPLRLFTSHLFLIAAGTSISFLLSLIFIPALKKKLPRDRGREFAVESQAAVGKPTGGGIIFITIFFIISILFVPFSIFQLIILLICMFAMITGYLDDRSKTPWNEYLKGFLDLVIAVGAAVVLYYSREGELWLPFTKQIFRAAPILYIPLSALIIWVSINSTNCTDGIDGLSSTLVLLALMSMGVFLYFVIGHVVVSGYLLLPHYENGARWAIMIFALVGSLGGYLWHNAYPSSVLMGDAGSRALGFIIGTSIILSGNPFFILIAGGVMLINGGTGLIKVVLLRFFKIKIFHNVRFPLHDHFRYRWKWSNTQVLIRYSLIQMLTTIVLFGIFVKIR